MSEPGIRSEQERIGNNLVTVVTLPETLNAANAAEVRSSLSQIIDTPSTHLILDLSSVDFMDSMGLSVLISVLRACRSQERILKLCGLKKQVQMLFSVTGMDTVFQIYESTDQAKQEF